MPAKRKWSSEELALAETLFHSDKPQAACASTLGVYHQTLRKLWEELFGKAAVRARFARMCAISKTGGSNPMTGRTGALHHNHVDSYVNSQGYRMVDAPDWYAGHKKAGKAPEHIIVYCESAGIAKLPAGHVVHHVDHDRLNNSLDNLQMMSVGDHMRLHNLKV